VKSNFNNVISESLQFCAHLASSPTEVIFGSVKLTGVTSKTTLSESSTCLNIAQTSSAVTNTFILRTAEGNLKIILAEFLADGTVNTDGYLLSSEIYLPTTYGFSIENGGYGVWGNRNTIESISLSYSVGYIQHLTISDIDRFTDFATTTHTHDFTWSTVSFTTSTASYWTDFEQVNYSTLDVSTTYPRATFSKNMTFDSFYKNEWMDGICP